MEFEVVPLPLLTGLHRLKFRKTVTHNLLDIYLWLPRREGFMAFGPLDCRLQQVIYNKDDSSYYEYTLIYMEQVRFYFVTRISKTDAAGCCDNVVCSQFTRGNHELNIKGSIIFVKSLYNFTIGKAEGVVNVTAEDCSVAKEMLKE